MDFPLIIKSMAIIRCPYCHAIIDENDKYCNNCGTQLLFPEDEAVEEEIPGEKIIDVEEEEEEKDYDLHEPGKETTALIEEEEPVGEKEVGVEGRDTEGGEEKTREVVVVEGTPAGEAAADTAPPGAREKPACQKSGPEEETRAYPVPPAGEKEPMDETVEMLPPPVFSEKTDRPSAEAQMPGGTGTKTDAEKPQAGEAEDAEERPRVPATFDTRELEGIGKTVDLGKERLDRMIEVMGEKQQAEASGEASKPAPAKKTGTLPPWANRIKGGDAVVEREDTQDLARRFDKEPEEDEIFPRRKRPDSGIGLPEGVTQATLPFVPPAEEGEEGGSGEEETFEQVVKPPEAARPKRDETRPLLREEAAVGAGFEKEQEAEEEIEHPPFQIVGFIKAKAFDVLFIGVIWLVALWVAARSMNATLFELLSVTSGSGLLLYVAFVLLYFFLFKFFLGETLGDRLFRERE